MVASDFDFVNVVAADRDLVVTTAHDHFCRLEPRESDLAWFCDLDDGTPTDSDRDPDSFVRWVCPALRVGRSATATAVPLLDVYQPGPHSDLGRLMQGLGRLVGLTSRRTPGGDSDGRFVYTDAAGILDVGLRQRIENWPLADHGDGVVGLLSCGRSSSTAKGSSCSRCRGGTVRRHSITRSGWPSTSLVDWKRSCKQPPAVRLRS